MNTAIDELCTCMDAVFDPPDPPNEHAESCPLRRAIVEYRTHVPGDPHEADNRWTTDRIVAEDELAALHATGDTRYRIDRRLALPADSRAASTATNDHS